MTFRYLLDAPVEAVSGRGVATGVIGLVDKAADGLRPSPDNAHDA